jgi:hypothetical protein
MAKRAKRKKAERKTTGRKRSSAKSPKKAIRRPRAPDIQTLLATPEAQKAIATVAEQAVAVALAAALKGDTLRLIDEPTRAKSIVRYCYLMTADENWVERCEYGPDGRCNLNCQRIPASDVPRSATIRARQD